MALMYFLVVKFSPILFSTCDFAGKAWIDVSCKPLVLILLIRLTHHFTDDAKCIGIIFNSLFDVNAGCSKHAIIYFRIFKSVKFDKTILQTFLLENRQHGCEIKDRSVIVLKLNTFHKIAKILFFNRIDCFIYFIIYGLCNSLLTQRIWLFKHIASCTQQCFYGIIARKYEERSHFTERSLAETNIISNHGLKAIICIVATAHNYRSFIIGARKCYSFIHRRSYTIFLITRETDLNVLCRIRFTKGFIETLTQVRIFHYNIKLIARFNTIFV